MERESKKSMKIHKALKYSDKINNHKRFCDFTQQVLLTKEEVLADDWEYEENIDSLKNKIKELEEQIRNLSMTSLFNPAHGTMIKPLY